MIHFSRWLFYKAFTAETSAPKESRPIVITIEKWEGKQCSKSGGKCYYLSRKTAGLSRSQKIPIYWLAYKDNAFTLGTLNNQSLYMFTALMNGCTLGFGSQSGDGSCSVSHANKKSAGGGVAQRNEQHDLLVQRFGGGDFSEVAPSAYGNSKGWQATNFGANVNGIWKFYTHVSSNDFQLTRYNFAWWMQTGGLNSRVSL